MDNKATPEADKVKPKFNLDGDIDDENTIVSGIEVMFAHIQDANVKKNLMTGHGYFDVRCCLRQSC